jgi:hypothetical protein
MQFAALLPLRFPGMPLTFAKKFIFAPKLLNLRQGDRMSFGEEVAQMASRKRPKNSPIIALSI